MRKFVIIAVILILGVKYGYDYLLSEKFEAWADQTKEPLSCQFENVAGYMHIVMSEYQKGYYRFSHTISRCPDTEAAEVAEFNIARCLENMGQRSNAKEAYEAFTKKYPQSPRARIAARAASII